MVDDAVLVVSEIATNVVLHARTPFIVSLSRAEGQLLLEVTDASSAQPRLAWSDDPLATSGRGLSSVAILSQAWGVDNAPDGAKRVWACLPIPGVGDSGVGRPMLDDPGGRFGALPTGSRGRQLSARAASVDPWITNTFTRPVMRKILSNRS